MPTPEHPFCCKALCLVDIRPLLQRGFPWRGDWQGHTYRRDGYSPCFSCQAIKEKHLGESCDLLLSQHWCLKPLEKDFLLAYGVGLGAPFPFAKKNFLHLCQTKVNSSPQTDLEKSKFWRKSIFQSLRTLRCNRS